jgi:hypothetical protein
LKRFASRAKGRASGLALTAAAGTPLDGAPLAKGPPALSSRAAHLGWGRRSSNVLFSRFTADTWMLVSGCNEERESVKEERDGCS